MKIVLMGYMASGKSTIGKQLSKKMNFPFIDLDTYIEKKERLLISEIFKKKGEIYFRNQEHTYLKELIHSHTNFVLAIGGGTPCYAENMSLISRDKNTVSVYLKASIQTIVERLKVEKHTRPLIATIPDEKLTEFISKHLFERTPFYEKATYKVSIDTKKIEELIRELKKLVY